MTQQLPPNGGNPSGIPEGEPTGTSFKGLKDQGANHPTQLQGFGSIDLQHTVDNMVSNTNDLGQEGLTSLERKRVLAREVNQRQLLSPQILKTYPAVYAGSFTDVEFPLTLGCRNIVMVDPSFADQSTIDDVIKRVETIRGGNSVRRMDNTLSFDFDFGSGIEQVKMELVAKYYNPERMSKNHPFYDPSQEIPDEQVYNLPHHVGLLLGFQSHFTQIQEDDLQKIVSGGYIIDNRIGSVSLRVTPEDYAELEQQDGVWTPEHLQRKYGQLGLDTVEVKAWDDYHYTFLRKR